jgi:DNA-binding NarL/FixJ family response regulator
VEPLRTASVALTPLFRDLLVRSLSDFIALNFVGHVESREGAPQQLAQLAPDLILLRLAQNESAAQAREAADEFACEVVLAFSSNLRKALVFHHAQNAVTLEDPSTARLANAIASLRECIIQTDKPAPH